MVETGGLENRLALTGYGGSNPSPSAKTLESGQPACVSARRSPLPPAARIIQMQMRSGLRRFFVPGETSDANVASGWNSRNAQRIFWAALAIRLLYMTLAHTYRIRVADDHFQFGWEMGRIARALVTHRGYADPFAGHSGPTAWTPPLYPMILAAAFQVFGVYTNAAGWAVLAVNSVASAATAPAIYEIAARCYSKRKPDVTANSVALWSGWLWALYPAALQYAVRWPWDMAVTVMLFTWSSVLALRLRGVGGLPQAERRGPWSLWGLLWGLIALTNSSLLTFLPFEAAWILWPLRHRLLSSLRAISLAGAVFLACISPWILRNALVLHAFIPMRDNFGAELYMSALPSHDGFPYGTVLPLTINDPEWQRYAQVGEVAYSRVQGQRGKALIAGERPQFLRWVLLRVQFFWAGVPHPYDHGALNEFLRQLDYSFLSVSGLLGLLLSLRRRIPGATLFAGAFAVLPLLYYVITVQARFRAPLEPLITIFSVYLFQSADRSRTWTRRSSPLPSARHEVSRA